MAGTTSTIPILIGNTLIQFPNTGASPIWSEAVIEFALAVSLQLQTIASPFDIAPTVYVLTSNANVNLPLAGSGANASFPTGSVRSFVFTYAIYRVTSTDSVTDSGTVTGVFNTDTASWTIEHDFVGDVQANGEAYHTFDINGSNEIVLTTVALSGVYDSINSKISYSAKTELVST